MMQSDNFLQNHSPQCAEWLAEIGDKELPDDIRDHLEKCLDCKMEVLEVGEISYD